MLVQQLTLLIPNFLMLENNQNKPKKKSCGVYLYYIFTLHIRENRPRRGIVSKTVHIHAVHIYFICAYIS